MKTSLRRGLTIVVLAACAAGVGCVSSLNAADSEMNTAQRWLDGATLAPPFVVPGAAEAWQQKRREVRAELSRLLGDLPPRPAVPAVRVLSREDRGSMVVEKLEFDNGAGATVPGWLALPKERVGRVPAILYCHWHGGEYEVGKAELFQKAHTPDVPAEALVRRGWAVLAVDAYCFGERSGKGPGGPGERGGAEEMSASKFNLWAGRSLWGMILRDDQMALDYLVSRPEVDPQRVGVTGISMGATRTWWLMALDERLKAGVAVACLTRYQDLIQAGGLKHHGIYYFVPGMLRHFDSEAVVALIAPRPVLFMTGEEDAGSPPQGVRRIEAAARPAWRLQGKDDAFESVLYPGLGHVYTPEMWERMLKWFDRHLAQP